jgi:hypothetical protein
MPTDRETWPQAMATVTECRYDVRAGRALAFGLPSGKHFRIRYNYNADGQLHTGEFYSATAIPQNTLFPIRYNPAATHDHTHESSAATTPPNPRRAMLLIGIAGSVILSLAWLLILRGCK